MNIWMRLIRKFYPSTKKGQERRVFNVEIDSSKDSRFKCQCGGTEFLEGPHGGDAVNFACKQCWARYNDMWPFNTERYGTVQESERFLFHGSYRPRGY